MRKMLLIGALLAVSACATGYYEPKLAEPATDQAAFKNDALLCNAEQERRSAAAAEAHKDDARAAAAFGALGSAVVNSGGNPQDDWHKTPGQIIDECMTAKGYKVISQNGK